MTSRARGRGLCCWQHVNPDVTDWLAGMTSDAFFRDDVTGAVLHVEITLVSGDPCTFAGTFSQA